MPTEIYDYEDITRRIAGMMRRRIATMPYMPRDAGGVQPDSDNDDLQALRARVAAVESTVAELSGNALVVRPTRKEIARYAGKMPELWV